MSLDGPRLAVLLRINHSNKCEEGHGPVSDVHAYLGTAASRRPITKGLRTESITRILTIHFK